jgi:hypothetical protein
VSNWRSTVTSNRAGSGAGVPSSAEVQIRPYGTLTVYPNELVADDLRSRVTFEGGDYAGDRPEAEQWANVLMTGYEGGELSGDERTAIDDCIEEAATDAADAPAGTFEDCGDRARVERLSVRGISCGRAAGLLDPKGRLGRCTENGGDYTCLSEYLCCMLSAQYMGNGEAEIIFDF